MPRILIAILLLLIVALQLKLWGREGMAKVDDLEQAIAAQRAENERLKARNAALEAEVVNLKESREAIEERARAELGLIAEDETFYHVIDDSAVDAPAKEPEQ
jgi:cell division protein FtsB